MPEALHLLQKVSLLVFLVSSMLAIGLSVAPRAIIAPLCRKRLVLTALAVNFLLAPVLAWVLLRVVPLERGYAIGLLVLSGAAGAPFIPKLVESARADAALGVALLVLLTAGTILFLPFCLPWMIPGFRAAAWEIARPLLLLIALPLVAGVVVKGRAPSFSRRAVPILQKASTASLLLLVSLLVGLNLAALKGVFGTGAGLVVALYVALLFLAGWWTGGPDPQERGVSALAASARNFGAALVPATTSFADPKVSVMIIVSAIVSLVVCFLAAAWVRRRMPLAPVTPATL